MGFSPCSSSWMADGSPLGFSVLSATTSFSAKEEEGATTLGAGAAATGVGLGTAALEFAPAIFSRRWMAAEVSLRGPNPADPPVPVSDIEEVDATFRREPPLLPEGADFDCGLLLALVLPLLLLLLLFLGLGCRCPCDCVVDEGGRLCVCLRAPSAAAGAGLDGVRVTGAAEGGGAAELPAPPAAASSSACRLNSLVEDATVPDPDTSNSAVTALGWVDPGDLLSFGCDGLALLGLAVAAGAVFFLLLRLL